MGDTGNPQQASTPSPSLSTTSRSIGRRALRTHSYDNPLATPSELQQNAELPGESSSTLSTQYAVYSPSKKRTPLPPFGTHDGGPSASTSESVPSPSTSAPPPFSSPPAATSIPPLISRPSNSSLPYSLPPPRHPSSRTGRPYARSVSEAQEMLLGQALKAELQSLLGSANGNASESWGAAMVTALGGIEDGAAGEWSDVLGALSSGQVTLLLPAEKMPNASTIDAAMFKEYLAVFEDERPAPAGRPTNEDMDRARGFATLSGLRGVMTSSQLIFGSTSDVMLTAKAGSALDYTDAEIKRQTFGNIFPSKSMLLPGSSLTSFPTNKVMSDFSTLSIPRSSRSSAAHLAALSRQSTGSRLAALFAKQPSASSTSSSTVDSDLPPVVPAPEGVLDSVAGAARSGSSHNLEAKILAVSQAVHRNTLSNAINNAQKLYLRHQLSLVPGVVGDKDETSPGLVEGVCGFANRFAASSSLGGSTGNAAGKKVAAWNSIEEAADAWADLAEATRTALVKSIGTEDEAAVDASLEQIESIVMDSLYDRMFDSPLSSDGAEDDLLKRRIEALRDLGIGLEHLGVDMDSEGGHAWEGQRMSMWEALEAVVHLVGSELAKLELEDVRTPKAKLDVFVNLHKIIVEELSSLPPVPLKKEVDTSSLTSIEKRPSEVEMDDASSRAGTSSKSSSRPASPPPGSTKRDDGLLRTPKPHSDADIPVPEMALPGAELAMSVHEATSSSMFDRQTASARPTPPSSVFDSSRASSQGESAAPSLHASPSSSADLILPILIYAVISQKPVVPLASHVKFALRFRAESLLRGEANYCATNMQAVIEFLNTVDMSALGLAPDANALPTLQRTTSPPASSNARPSTANSTSSGRTSISFIVKRPNGVQDIDQFVDSANHALVRAADMLFGPKGLAPKTIEDVKNVLDGAGSVAKQARGSLLRRATYSSQAGNTQQIEKSTAQAEGPHREMVGFVAGSSDAFDAGTTVEYTAEKESMPPPPLPSSTTKPADDDTRSIRSISSIIRDSSLVGKISTHADEQRQSLGGRLANIPGLGRFSSSSESRATGAAASSGMTSSPSRGSIFAAFAGTGGSPVSSRRNTVSSNAAPTVMLSSADSAAVQPVARFLQLEQADELRIGDVAELLREYKKLAGALVGMREREKERQQKQESEAGIEEPSPTTPTGASTTESSAEHDAL